MGILGLFIFRDRSNTSERGDVGNISSGDEALTAPLELPLVESGTATLTVALPENYYSPAGFASNLPVYEKMEELTGVKIIWEVSPEGDYQTVMSTRLAAAQGLPDIFDSRVGKAAGQLLADGLTVDLQPLIAENAFYLNRLFEMNPTVLAGITNFDGSIAVFPGLGEGIIKKASDMETGVWENPGANITMFVPAIRKDWLDKLGLDMPVTIDDWYTVLKAFKEQDPNGNGVSDEIPIAPSFGYADLLNFSTAFGLYKSDDSADFWGVNDDGTFFCKYSDPRMKETLVFLNKLYSEGLLDREFASTNWTKTNEKINMELTGSLTGGWNSNLASFNNNLKAAGVEDVNWTSVKFPQDPSGNSKIYARWSVFPGAFISKDCKTPELALQWLDLHCLSPEGILLQTFGIEGVSYGVDADGNPQVNDFVINNPDGLGAMEALRSIGAWSQLPYVQTTEAYQSINRVDTDQVDFANSYDVSDVMSPFPGMILTPEEQEIYNDILPTIRTYMDEKLIGFIDGSISLDEFDGKFIEELEALRLQELLDIVEESYDRFQKAL